MCGTGGEWQNGSGGFHPDEVIFYPLDGYPVMVKKKKKVLSGIVINPGEEGYFLDQRVIDVMLEELDTEKEKK